MTITASGGQRELGTRVRSIGSGIVAFATWACTPAPGIIGDAPTTSSSATSSTGNGPMTSDGPMTSEGPDPNTTTTGMDDTTWSPTEGSTLAGEESSSGTFVESTSGTFVESSSSGIATNDSSGETSIIGSDGGSTTGGLETSSGRSAGSTG